MTRWLPGLILVYFIVGVALYAAATPIFESPDEASHFLYAHNLNITGKLPILEDRDTVFASRAVQRHHPPLYYLLGSVLLTGTTRANLPAYLHDNPFAHYGTVAINNANVLLHPIQPPPGDTMHAAWRLRLLSLVFACGTLLCVYRVGLMAFGRGVGLAAMFLVASIPSFVSISGSINNDNAVTFFYSAGIAWTVWVWQKRTLRLSDALILGAILAGAALSKITGLTLIGFVGLVLLVGGLRRRFEGLARQTPTYTLSIWLVIRTGLIAGLCVVVLAGWWYLRNFQLYGDALALTATNVIWGRMPPTDPEQIRSEAWGVWESFWLILGHFNVRGPDWLYPYITGVSVVGSLGVLASLIQGVVGAWRAKPDAHGDDQLQAQNAAPLQLILLCAVGIVVGALIFATRTVNVSQGRILFPALAAFAPLLIVGLQVWTRGVACLAPSRIRDALSNALMLLIFVPLVIAHLMTPFTSLASAFAPPMPIDALPETAIPMQANAEGLRLLGYHIEPNTITPDESVQVNMYIQGVHAADPILYLKLVDPLTLVPIGGLDVYPGMTPVSQLDPSQIYEFVYTVPINRTQLTGRTPRRLDLVIGWHTPGADPGTDEGLPIPWTLANGSTSDSLRVPGPTLIDPDYVPPAPALPIDVVYGGVLKLVGATVIPTEAAAGDTISVALVWQSVGPMTEDWTLALGLLDADGHVIAQADGPLAGYPTSAWRTGTMTEDTRTLTIPMETPQGELRLFIGWYRPTDANQRLAAQGAGIDNDLFISTPVITIK